MNLEKNEETQSLISLVKTTIAPMVTRGVLLLLEGEEEVGDDSFLHLNALHRICVVGKEEGTWDEFVQR